MAQTAGEPDRRSVAFFASERIDGRWINSYFVSIPGGDLSFNECEGALNRALSERGYRTAPISLVPEHRLAAKRLGTVFKRYNDLSMIPNDTVVKAASVVDEDASVVIACRALIEKPGWRSGKTRDLCVAARCKAVDIESKKRVGTSSGVRCPEPGSGEGGRLEAIRLVCGDMAMQLEGGLAKR